MLIDSVAKNTSARKEILESIPTSCLTFTQLKLPERPTHSPQLSCQEDASSTRGYSLLDNDFFSLTRSFSPHSATTQPDSSMRKTRVIPSGNYIPSNRDQVRGTDELLYIHGMLVTTQDLALHLRYLAVCFGKPITAIINQPRPLSWSKGDKGALRSVTNGTLGVVSSEWGTKVERIAVLTTARAIQKLVFEEHKRLQIIAHSQGSIILANSIDLLLSERSGLSLAEKGLLKERIQIMTFGAAEHYYPIGIETIEHAHTKDIVTAITNPTTKVRQAVTIGAKNSWERIGKQVFQYFGLGSVAGYLPTIIEKSRAPVTHLTGDHSFKSYLENLPKFFIARWRSSDGQVNSIELAMALLQSIKAGDFSDIIHTKIIEERVRERDYVFRQVLRAHSSREGMIDNFQIPMTIR